MAKYIELSAEETINTAELIGKTPADVNKKETINKKKERGVENGCNKVVR